MYQIQTITADPLQYLNLILLDGSALALTIYFIPMQYGWFITSLNYGSFTLQGMRISNNPNLLRQFKNQLPFGLGCFSQNNREPSQANDFVSGASSLFVLTAAEVIQYEAYLA
jgi:hypothetical protein